MLQVTIKKNLLLTVNGFETRAIEASGINLGYVMYKTNAGRPEMEYDHKNRSIHVSRKDSKRVDIHFINEIEIVGNLIEVLKSLGNGKTA